MIDSKRVAFYTLGCKLNFSETSAISRQMTDAGYAKVDFSEPADYYVINTCSVTDNADKKCKSLVRKCVRNNPDASVIIIGCYAQLKPEEISSIPGVSMVLGAKDKFKLAEHIENQKESSENEIYIQNSHIKEVKEFNPSFSYGDRTRSFLKVQDGCDYFCAFCTIPLARGRSRSASIEKTLTEAKKVAATDIREVVLTGVNIGDFGKGSEENEDFFGLVKELDQVEGIDRFRISSIEPNLLSNEIIEFVAQSQRFVPHFHIPLQSGSDKLLQDMRRKYLTDLYADRVHTIKKKMPDACIGVDVIVGFPGETDEEFEKTLNFLKEIDASYFHVFSYSERANTTALRIDEVVPKNVRSERSKILQLLSSKKKRAFYEQFTGQTRTVLMESENHEGFMHGFTDNYLKVKIPYQEELSNQLVEIQLNRLNGDTEFEGEVVTLQHTV